MKPYSYCPKAADSLLVWTHELWEKKIFLLSCLDTKVWWSRQLFFSRRKFNTTEWAELHEIQSNLTTAGVLLSVKVPELFWIYKGSLRHPDATSRNVAVKCTSLCFWWGKLQCLSSAQKFISKLLTHKHPGSDKWHQNLWLQSSIGHFCEQLNTVPRGIQWELRYCAHSNNIWLLKVHCGWNLL